MRIFKNGIDVKWLLLAIGIFAISGFAVATTDPIIGDSINYLDALNITRWVRATQFIDADNTTYYIDPANPNVAVNVQGNIVTDNLVSIRSTNTQVYPTSGKSIEMYYNQVTDKGYIYGYDRTAGTPKNISIAAGTFFLEGVLSTVGTDDIACIDPTSKEVTKNTGSATTCAASAEKYKNIIGKFTDPLTIFMSLEPIVFQAKDDVKQLDRLGFSANKVAVLYPQVIYTRYQGNGTFVRVILNQSDPTKADSILYSDGTIASIEGINYEMFSAILVSRVQQQQEQLDIQSAQIRNICTNNPQLCS